MPPHPPLPEPGPWAVTSADYYADHSRISHSMLEDFRRSVPRYAALYVDGTLTKEATAEMRFGSAFHTALLEPATFEQLFAVAPDCDLRTKAGRQVWADFEDAELGDRQPITLDERAKLTSMLAAVMSNPYARSACQAAGKVERPISWTHAASGLVLKSKPDKVLDNGLLLDVKTCRDPSPEAFSRDIWNYGYHRQAALYLDGCWECWRADGPFVFIVVGKEAPHEVVVYEPDATALDVGRRQNEAELSSLAERYAKNDWSSPWAGAVQHVGLPRWALAQVAD